MEQTLATQADIPFAPIATGKLRRYFSWENLRDTVRVPVGVVQALVLLHRFKPDVVFSKGGYVAVPVVWAAWLTRIPIVIHESDLLPGLATKITMRVATKICLGWQETMHLLPKNVQKKVIVTGHPIRPEILHGHKKRGLAVAGFRPDLPVVLVMGGSLGAQKINMAIEGALERLMQYCQVIHICGKGNPMKKHTLKQPERYKIFPYIHTELPHIYAAADVVVSRAGAGSLAELTALKKPLILVPLSRRASRGDQIENAYVLERKGGAVIIHDEKCTPENLGDAVIALLRNPRRAAALGNRAHQALHKSAAEKVVHIIQKVSVL